MNKMANFIKGFRKKIRGMTKNDLHAIARGEERKLKNFSRKGITKTRTGRRL